MPTTPAVIDYSPTGLLNTLPGWENLQRKDQIAVERATKTLEGVLMDYGRSRLAIGEQLSVIQEKLQSTNMFSKYLETFHFKRSTAYKAIKEYSNAVQWLPEPVLRRAMSRNMPMLGAEQERPLGVYTDPVKRLPPPDTEEPKVIDQWLDTIEQARIRADSRSKKFIEVEADFEALLIQAYRFASLRINKLPKGSKIRRQFLDKLVGMLLAELGIASGQTFEPEAIPEGYRAEVGRPRKAA